jgi:hypothetical protein
MSEEEPRFLNRYVCPGDGAAWEDQWSCTCNDRCPVCNKEIEPGESVDLAYCGDTDYVHAPLPEGWTPERTRAFAAYLDAHHGSDAENPAFGYVDAEAGLAYCEDPAVLAAAMAAAAQH